MTGIMLRNQGMITPEIVADAEEIMHVKPKLQQRMISMKTIGANKGEIFVSKGSKAVCMRFPEPLMGGIEEEAAALGISAPELCRRIIAERNQAIEEEEVKVVQVTLNTRPVTNSNPIASPRTGAPALSPVNRSQKSEASMRAGMSAIVDAQVMQKIKKDFPELLPPAEAQKRARGGLANLFEKNPEALEKYIIEQMASGKMSSHELVRFLALLEH